MIKKSIKFLHHNMVFKRRITVLSKCILQLLPEKVKILDIGCGDGTISNNVRGKRPEIDYQGIDIVARPTCSIPFKLYNGEDIPYDDHSFDIVQFIDVLHHTMDLKLHLENALKITRQYVLIKDHICNNRLDFAILKFMDWLGNAPYGIKLVYNFKSKEYWDSLFTELNLEVVYIKNRIMLYPQPFNLIFGRNLHFVALLKKNKDSML